MVVGSTTQGKGLVQTIAPLPDGGELFISWSRVFAPLGWPVQGLGVLPQVCTSFGAGGLERQLAGLAHGRQSMADALARHRAARPPLNDPEVLELRSACPAARASPLDLVAARRLIHDPGAYAAALLGSPDVPTGLQAEQRATVIERIELHVPPAAVDLVFTVGDGPGPACAGARCAETCPERPAHTLGEHQVAPPVAEVMMVEEMPPTRAVRRDAATRNRGRAIPWTGDNSAGSSRSHAAS